MSVNAERHCRDTVSQKFSLRDALKPPLNSLRKGNTFEFVPAKKNKNTAVVAWNMYNQRRTNIETHQFPLGVPVELVPDPDPALDFSFRSNLTILE